MKLKKLFNLIDEKINNTNENYKVYLKIDDIEVLFTKFFKVAYLNYAGRISYYTKNIIKSNSTYCIIDYDIIFNKDYIPDNSYAQSFKYLKDVFKSSFLRFATQEAKENSTITIGSSDRYMRRNSLKNSTYYYYPEVEIEIDDERQIVILNMTKVDKSKKSFAGLFAAVNC